MRHHNAVKGIFPNTVLLRLADTTRLSRMVLIQLEKDFVQQRDVSVPSCVFEIYI